MHLVLKVNHNFWGRRIKQESKIKAREYNFKVIIRILNILHRIIHVA